MVSPYLSIARFGVASLLMMAMSASVVAQTAAPAIEAAPLAAPSAGAVVPKVEPSPAQQSTPQGALSGTEVSNAAPVPTLTSLAPPASEVTLPDSLELAAKPAIVVRGKAQWETAYSDLRAAFARGQSAAAKAGLVVTGYPITVFVETNDTAFTYDAIVPIASAPTALPLDVGADIKLGTTPSGKAIRFAYLASYDEIDGAYEQITAYLDAKDIVVKDAFFEEYLVFGETSASPGTTINIFVQPKK
jgi:effector-binding domain-containing protein